MTTVGLGAVTGVRADEVLVAVVTALAAAGAPLDGGRLATLDARAGEPGVLTAAEQLGWPVTGYPAAVLAEVPVPAPSARVAEAVGTPSVAEAAALAGGGALLLGKTVVGRVTVAVAG